MNERRRFLVALSGLAGSLGLAAGIALTGPVRPSPQPVAVAPVPAAPAAAMAMPLPALPVPASAPARRDNARPPDPAPAPAARAPRALAAVHVPVPVQSRLPALEHGQRRPPSRALLPGRAYEAALSASAPTAVAAPPPAPGDPAARRGAVSQGVAAAGHHMGAGFGTAGRTLRRLF
jgi:hypothetical protein